MTKLRITNNLDQIKDKEKFYKHLSESLKDFMVNSDVAKGLAVLMSAQERVEKKANKK